MLETPDEVTRTSGRDISFKIQGYLKSQVHAFRLPPIVEEKTPTIKVAPETYPLRKPSGHGEVLLVSYSDLKNIMETKIGFKCDEAYMEDNSMEKIQQRIRDV